MLKKKRILGIGWRDIVLGIRPFVAHILNANGN